MVGVQVLNISSTKGITQSGRSYASKEVEKQRKAKAKEAIITPEELGKDQVEINKPTSEEEMVEFLKLIKQIEYNIMDQLEKMPTRIFFSLSYSKFRTIEEGIAKDFE